MSSALALVRAAQGAEGVRSAIASALAAHATPSEAARALGVTLRTLRRAARRAGVPWPVRPAGRPRREAPDAG